MKDTIIDRIVSYVSPSKGLERVQAKQRLLRYKAATNNGRLRSNAASHIDPESSTYQRDRYTLIKEVRALVENSPFVQGIVQKYASYAVGNVRYQARSGDKKTNKIIEEYFKSWAKSPDITGRFCLQELAHIVIMAERTDGDVFAAWIQEDGSIPKLQIIEADCIGNPQSSNSTQNYVGGIHIDNSGKPLAYDVYRRERNASSYAFEKQIHAQNIIHFLANKRPSQYRGISVFAPVIDRIKDIEEILEAELVGVKANSVHAAIVFNESGSVSAEDLLSGSSTKDVEGNDVSEIENKYGRFWFLKQGDKVKTKLGNRPGSTFSGFIEAQIRDIATALNLPYGVIYNLSGLTGPGSRAELSMADREFQRIQFLLTSKFLNPIRDRIIFYGSAMGIIPFDPFDPSIYEGHWQFPAKMSIDAGRDSAAAINEVRAGMRTKASWYAQQGDDADDAEAVIFAEAEAKIESAKELSAKHGIPINTALEMLGNPSTYPIQKLDSGNTL